MWDLQAVLDVKLPEDWEIQGVYSTVNGETLEMYFKNMRNLLMNQLVESELIVVNRCGEDVNRATFRRSIKIQNPVADILFENPEGEIIPLTEEDYEVLLRIVEAEAGGEDRKGKLLVANVIINRVKNEHFPDTITDVIFQQDNGVCQFSPIRDGRFYSVRVSDETVEAVNAALYGEDYSDGALYFMARKHADDDKAEWFDRHLTRLFAYGGHEFFC